MYHLWMFDKRHRRLTMLTKRLVKDRSGGKAGEYVYDETSYPAVWKNRASAQKYGATRYDRGAFKVLKCEGDACGMGNHVTP